MALAWQDATAAEQARAFGPPALIAPPPQRLGIAGSSDGHLPPDAQRQFCHGRALSLLPAARLGQATALANVSTGAEATGAGLLGDVPAASRNDDRLGRAPDAFFTQRHPILATVAAEALRRAERAPQRLHCDATHLIFHGACEAPQPRPDDTPGPPRSSADVPPAPLTHGYAAAAKLLHVGIPAAVDRRGALPILGQCLDGNPNNHTAVRQQPGWLPGQGLLAPAALPVSDRGTFSVEHVARRHRRGCPVLCSAPWADQQALYDAPAGRRRWQRAGFLSLEQRRRRQAGAPLPPEPYDPAVPCRAIVVQSSAGAVLCRQAREQDTPRLHAGPEGIAAPVARGPPRTTPASSARRVAELCGRRAAARCSGWELLPLPAAAPAALPEPGRGCRRPGYRFTFALDARAAEAAAAYDGLSVLVTTAPRAQSAAAPRTQYKGQNQVALSHHPRKAPRAVRPAFLKSPRRVEALVCLRQVALTAYHLLGRFQRQGVPEGAAAAGHRRTAESLLREFRGYGLIERQTRLGRVVRATGRTGRQRPLLRPWGFPAPAQRLAQVLPPLPPG